MSSFSRKMKVATSAWLYRALQQAYTGYIELVLKTTRWRYVGFEQAERDIANGIPRIFCMWHGRLAAMPYFRDWRDQPFASFVSDHRDAQIATMLMRKKGLEVIDVQTSGNKTGSIRAAVKAAKAGSSVGITPDGPLGPREIVQPGAIMIASQSQTRLSPVAYSTRRRFVLNTWDRFVLPLPFGRGAFVMADGDIPATRLNRDQMAALQSKLGTMIDDVSQQADRIADLKSQR